MTREALCLLCLGLCLGYEGETRPGEPPPSGRRPSLSAWPSWVVEPGGNVTLRCRVPFQNVSVMLGRLGDPRYRQERSSAGAAAEFPLGGLEPQDAGSYSCAYRTSASREWSAHSECVQLVVTGSLPAPSLSVSADPGTPAGSRTLQCLVPYNGTECIAAALLRTGVPEPLRAERVQQQRAAFVLRGPGEFSCVYYQCHAPHLGSFLGSLAVPATGPSVIFITAFSCLCIVLLFLAVFLIYRRTQRGSPREDSSRRTSDSSFSKQDDSDVSVPERRSTSGNEIPTPKRPPHPVESAWVSTSRRTGTDKGVTCAELNPAAPEDAASVPTEEPPGPSEHAAVTV
ncbi:V-set and transmembrane domain-containing protein 1-like [Lepus europaeus]|uniref:V-set and transmembrane domain-containing protein 1-like n=1 Tax=Lepus europaeus TaxID=9983 RepID=UPI002B48177B|nr:V-set and transmembrane domain-containing protein 1-like [Lepus europaeus]